MSPETHRLSRIGLIAVTLLAASPLVAAQRTFVSAASGIDANPCSRQLPCRNFAAAVTQTDSAGEVVVLDSGGYGIVTVTQSVSLVAPAGVHAAITASLATAIDVSAGDSDVVVVRGLYLSGAGGVAGSAGIFFRTGKALHVENCVISGFAITSGSPGIRCDAPDSEVYVKDTTLRQNGHGIDFSSEGAMIRASLDAIRVEENKSNGVSVIRPSLVTVRRAVVAGNGFNGIVSIHASGIINVESCTIASNGTNGINAAIGTIRVSNSLITGNATGVGNGVGASTISFGNNGLHGNTTDGAFTTTIPLQ
jgi:hypothetical protein